MVSKSCISSVRPTRKLLATAKTKSKEGGYENVADGFLALELVFQLRHVLVVLEQFDEDTRIHLPSVVKQNRHNRSKTTKRQ